MNNNYTNIINNGYQASHAYEQIQQNYNQQLELIIAKSAYWSYKYALNILKAPFPLGEPILITSNLVISYAYYSLKGRFKLLEQNITNITDKYMLSQYTKIIMEFNHD